MAIDEELAARIRSVLPRLNLLEDETLGEIKMFGGLCFTINRKMLVGVGKSRLMVRISDEDFAATLAAGIAEPMDFTGKPLRNFAYIREEGYATDADLLERIEASCRFVRSQMRHPGNRRL